MSLEHPSILLIYTGGTIGMIQDHRDGSLQPFGFDQLMEHIPELTQLKASIATTQLSEIIDSSDMNPSHWLEMAQIIEQRYEQFDGFVILHGTDTMAYTSSALSYIIKGLAKPVILTGSQLPMGTIRTDGKENLITAIEIAASRVADRPIIQEVAVYFEYHLMRGNRVTKYSAEHFDAFHSPDYPHLAEAGVDIEFNHPFLSVVGEAAGQLCINADVEENIAVLKLFPGISEASVHAVLGSSARGIVMESFGSGNGPKSEWFIAALRQAVADGKTILNISQCPAGTVEHGRYATSASFESLGIISGRDLSFEAGVTKLMLVLGNYDSPAEIKRALETSVAGEMDDLV